MATLPLVVIQPAIPPGSGAEAIAEFRTKTLELALKVKESLNGAEILIFCSELATPTARFFAETLGVSAQQKSVLGKNPDNEEEAEPAVEMVASKMEEGTTVILIDPRMNAFLWRRLYKDRFGKHRELRAQSCSATACNDEGVVEVL